MTESKNAQAVTEYIHEGFVPLVKIKGSQIESYHTDHLGTPKEVSNEAGELIWQGNYDEYGKVKVVKGETEQNIRFQGQYEDVETDLFYNRFRYYDADGCRYINQDPIGLNGGMQLYGYVHDPNSAVDAFGLAPWQSGKFGEWFDKASVQDIINNKDAVESALRGDGGMHEKFPVSMAAKAKELGFTHAELMSMSVETSKIQFEGVLDSDGKGIPAGRHPSPETDSQPRTYNSRASNYFHRRLMADLETAKTKQEALDIIERHHNKHMKSC